MPVKANNTVRLNRRAILLCSAAGILLLYLVYSWTYVGVSSQQSGTRLKRLNTWKKYDFVEVPPAIFESAKNVKVLEETVHLVVVNQTLKIFYRTVDQKAEEKKPAVLFLHGAASSSDIWMQLGSMQLVGALGYKPVAIDLPGWAKSKDSTLSKEYSGRFLEVLIHEMKLDRPVVVSASMSGMFALPYMMSPEPETCADRVGGFISLAPVATDRFSHAAYHRCEIPTMIVYGTKDETLGLTSVGNLRNMPNSEIEPMQDAGHAGYQERPDEWNRLLYNFLTAINRR